MYCVENSFENECSLIKRKTSPPPLCRRCALIVIIVWWWGATIRLFFIINKKKMFFCSSKILLPAAWIGTCAEMKTINQSFSRQSSSGDKLVKRVTILISFFIKKNTFMVWPHFCIVQRAINATLFTNNYRLLFACCVNIECGPSTKEDALILLVSLDI